VVDTSMSFLAVASMALAAFGVGRAALRALKPDEDDPLEIAVWSLALGLVLVGSVLAALGLAGWLDRTVIGVVTMAASFWGIGELLRAHAGLAQRRRDAGTRGNESEQTAGHVHVSVWAIRGAWILAAVVVGCRFLAASAPPIDAATLHTQLEIPKTWLIEGSLVYLPSNGDARLVPTAAMWRVWALALDGGVAAQLTFWALGILLALAAVVLARPVVGRRAAWISGGVVLLVPAVAYDMALVRDGLAASVLATLLLAAWRRGSIDDDGRGWFVVAGILLAGLLDGTVVSLSLIASLALVSAARLGRTSMHRRRLASGLAMMAATAAVVAAPMLARAIECGRSAGPGITAVARRNVADEPARDVGCVFLVAAPGLFIARRLRGLGVLLAITCGYALFAFGLSPTDMPQSLLPMVPVFAVALAWIACEWRRLPRPASFAANATLAVVLVAGSLPAVFDAADKWRVALGGESRDKYLLAHEPTYRAAALLNQMAPTQSRLLSADPRGFYFNCRVTPAVDWNRAVRRDDPKHALAPEDFAAMRAAGFTHVLLVEPLAEIHPVRSAASRIVRQPSSADGATGVMRLHEYVYQDGDEAARRYGLYMLR
jgi:hypothetical protein